MARRSVTTPMAPMMIGLRSWKALTSECTCPILAGDLDEDRLAAFAVDLEHQVAQVEAEEVAVHRLGGPARGMCLAVS